MRKVPKGQFCLDTQNGRTNHLLISTVTGVAPFVSYVRTLYKEWKEGRFDGTSQTISSERREPPVGIRIPRGAEPVRQRIAMVQVCAHGQPSLGSPRLVWRNRPRGRHPAQICGSLGTGCEQHDGLHMRPSGDDRAQQGNPEAPWIHRQGSCQGRGLLDSGAQVVASIEPNLPAMYPLSRCAAPAASHLSKCRRASDAAPHADLAKSAGLVQRDAGSVLREDPRLQGPDSIRFGLLDRAPAVALYPRHVRARPRPHTRRLPPLLHKRGGSKPDSAQPSPAR